ncbi:hypothetical protein [Streptomyces sp. bgisy031]|uniref:hypothetical protein n=1 Tax=Streptomyces sp. bgisy031 TaxID=3413772 RepID=UPI003D75885C
MLSTSHQAPAAIRRSGSGRIRTCVKNRTVNNAMTLAETAVKADTSQYTAPPGEALRAIMVAVIAKGVPALNEEITDRDAFIENRFHEHLHARVIRSLPRDPMQVRLLDAAVQAQLPRMGASSGRCFELGRS